MPRITATHDPGNPSRPPDSRTRPGESGAVPHNPGASTAHPKMASGSGRGSRGRSRGRDDAYRRLLQQGPLAIIELDHRGRFVTLNTTAEQIFGASAGALAGTYFIDRVAPEDRPRAATLAEPMRDSGEGSGRRLEIRVIDAASGERRLLDLRATWLPSDGEPPGVLALASDLTAGRDDERQLRMLHEALDAAAVGVALYAHDWRLLYANRRFGVMLADVPEQAQREMREVLERSGRWSGRLVLPEDAERDAGRLRVLAAAVDEPDDERCYFIVCEDDERQAITRDRQLRRAERLATAGTLVRGVAHELNNPLSAIINFAELMLLEDRSEEDQESLRIICREAERAASVVGDLLRLARRSTSNEGERLPVDLNEVVRNVQRLRRYAMNSHEIQLRVDLSPELPPVLADREELEQAVLHLVANAEQALLEHDGPRRLLLHTRGAGEMVSIYVSDTGPGIDPADVERIFDPFWTTRAPGEGTGLGLSLVQRIVENHHGVIHVDTEPGGGTTFRIDIPRSEPAEDSAPAAPRLEARAVPRRILVVDDEPAIRSSLERFLSRRGHQVTVAAEGGEALERIEEAPEPFDVIVSDLRMPGLAGDRLLAELRERGEDYDDRVIFMTGDALGWESSEIVRSAHHPVLLKPAPPAEVTAAIEQVERRRRGG